MHTQIDQQNADRVFREDLVLFVNSCFAATGQATFYRNEWEARLGIEFVHAYMCTNYREVYALCLALGINDFNTALVIFNLLRSPLQNGEDSRLQKHEGELIRHSLRRLPPQRVYRLFSKLRRRRVNNRRTRAVMRDYLRWRSRWDFDAMKYRRGLTDAARHTHLPISELAGLEELGTFLFDHKSQTRFKHTLFEHWRAAHYSQTAMYELPYTVAEGFAKKHEVPRARFLKLIEPKMTRVERARLMCAASSAGVELEVDLGEMPLLRLATYILSMSPVDRAKRRAELANALKNAAAKARRQTSVFDTNLRVAAVLDNSYSSRGARETRNRALAVALGADALLHATFEKYQAFWTSENSGAHLSAANESSVHPSSSPSSLREQNAEGLDVLVRAQGQTPIAQRLIAALRTKPDLVVVISDGWENDPPLATEAVLALYRRDLDPQGRCAFVHGNPVFDAETYEPKPLMSLMPTVGLRTPEDLLTMLPFARFASGHQDAEALLEFLNRRAEVFFERSERSGR